MNIKLIRNAYGAAEYTASYVSKAEPDTTRFREAIRKALQRSGSDSTAYTTLRRVANATIGVREVSAQETMWILLNGLHMNEKSRGVVRVKTLRHHKRSYRVTRKECLAALQGNNNVVVGIEFTIDTVETAYMARPAIEPFENMTNKFFWSSMNLPAYPPKPNARSPRWCRLDNNGFIKAMTKPQVVMKCPSFKPDPTNPDYCFAEFLLRTSWRSRAELPTEDDACLSRFSTFCTIPSRGSEEIRQCIDREIQLHVLAQENTAPEQCSPQPDWSIEVSNIVDLQSIGIPLTAIERPSHSLSRFSYSLTDIVRAERFIENEVLNDIHEQRRIRSEFQDAPLYQYPILQAESNMNDDQWAAFALCGRAD